MTISGTLFHILVRESNRSGETRWMTVIICSHVTVLCPDILSFGFKDHFVAAANYTIRSVKNMHFESAHDR